MRKIEKRIISESEKRVREIYMEMQITTLLFKMQNAALINDLIDAATNMYEKYREITMSEDHKSFNNQDLSKTKKDVKYISALAVEILRRIECKESVKNE